MLMVGARISPCSSRGVICETPPSDRRVMVEQIKSLLRDQLGLSPLFVVCFAGLVVHLLLNLALRKPLGHPLGLLAPLLLGIAAESYEIWHHYRHIGLFHPRNDPLLQILARHGLDVLVLLLAPALLVAFEMLRARAG